MKNVDYKLYICNGGCQSTRIMTNSSQFNSELELELELDASVDPSHPTDDNREES